MNERIRAAKETKEKLKVLKCQMEFFFSQLKMLDWRDLRFTIKQNGNSWSYTIYLPDSLSNDFQNILNSVDFSSKYRELFHYIIYGHPEDSYDGIVWHLQVHSNENNRIHISRNGLPFSFREKGVGTKLYKKIINEVGYISTSNYESYKYSDLLWDSIIKDQELYCFISSDEIVATLKCNIPENIIDILESTFGEEEVGSCIFDKEFCKKYHKEIYRTKVEKHCA